MSKITSEQYEEILNTDSVHDLNELLEKYAGIESRAYTAYQYFVNGGTFVGDSENYTPMEILKIAGVEVEG